MKCYISSKDKLSPKLKKVAVEVAMDLANKEINNLAEGILDRHIKMAVLALNEEFGFGEKRLERFVKAFNKQIKRVDRFDGDIGDFDFKINDEIKRMGFEKLV